MLLVYRTALAGITALALFLSGGNAVAAEVPRMTAAELNARLGEPGLVVVDTRIAADWSSSTAQIQGAVRRDPTTVAAWAGEYGQEQTLVVYCA